MFHGKPSHLDVPVDSLSVGSCQVWRVTCSWEDVRFPSACASESRGSTPTRCLQTAESAYTCIPWETLRPPTHKTPQPSVPFQWPGGLPGQVLNLNFDPNVWTTCAFRARIIVLPKYWLEFQHWSGLWTQHSSSCFTPVWRTWPKQKSCSTLLRHTRSITTLLQRGWTMFLHWKRQRSAGLFYPFRLFSFV